MRTPDEIKKSLECCSPEDGLDPFCNDCPYKKEKWCADTRNADALAYIQQLEANWQQVSKALCGKENATLDEVLQAVSQVKAEQKRLTKNHIEDMKIIGKLERERDAAMVDMKHSCGICKHAAKTFLDEPCNVCAIDTFYSFFEWRGVCPENTEED